MNMNYTADELAFRDEVRSFLDEKLPADIAAKVKSGRRMSREGPRALAADPEQAGLVRHSLAAGIRRVEWSAVQKHIWDEESTTMVLRV